MNNIAPNLIFQQLLIGDTKSWIGTEDIVAGVSEALDNNRKGICRNKLGSLPLAEGP
jgi:hypothetical protein